MVANGAKLGGGWNRARGGGGGPGLGRPPGGGVRGRPRVPLCSTLGFNVRRRWRQEYDGLFEFTIQLNHSKLALISAIN
ncbi:MAG: hypothetical protein IPK98_06500 [Chloracidobacterium sp.]|nr:hypothetical protein [Chloracidobacterium sp.]